MSSHISNVRPAPDQVIVDIANYVTDYEIKSDEAFDTARNCLMDTLGCGFEALDYPACTKPVSYTHLDVYKRQVLNQPLKLVQQLCILKTK